jgi:hypothetical protein
MLGSGRHSRCFASRDKSRYKPGHFPWLSAKCPGGDDRITRLGCRVADRSESDLNARVACLEGRRFAKLADHLEPTRGVEMAEGHSVGKQSEPMHLLPAAPFNVGSDKKRVLTTLL